MAALTNLTDLERTPSGGVVGTQRVETEVGRKELRF